MSKQQFFFCRHCGNIITYVNSSEVPVVCCGEKMQELVPNTVEASSEKHLPVIKQKENTIVISVGSISHPVTAEHHITWISLESKHVNQCKELKPTEKPEAVFVLTPEDEPIAAYAYCNLHGLWRKDAE